jgi:hypothetical protein
MDNQKEIDALRAKIQKYESMGFAGISYLEARVKELEAMLPEEMKHCSILFKECRKGHGWLTATNWVQIGCPTCRAEEAEAKQRVAESDCHMAKEKWGKQLERNNDLEIDLAAAKKGYLERADFAVLQAKLSSAEARVKELESLLSGRTISCGNCNEMAKKVEELELRLIGEIKI